MNTNHNLTVTIVAVLLALSALVVFCTGCAGVTPTLIHKGQAAPYTGYLVPVPDTIQVTPLKDKGGK